VPRELVMPIMLGTVFYVALLASYTWHTMAASAIAFLIFLPFSAVAYRRREAREKTAAPQKK
jgi:CDP-diacylglycerol--serine O-phosphatidyltransferase